MDAEDSARFATPPTLEDWEAEEARADYAAQCADDWQDERLLDDDWPDDDE